MKTEPWKIVVLEHDSASVQIGNFFYKIWKEGITRKYLDPDVIHTDKEDITKKIQKAVGNLDGKILTLYGHGDYHHYTYGLCKVVADKRSKNYIYSQIDQHTDSWRRADEFIRCASFVEQILEETEAKDIINIGTETKLGDHDDERIIIHQNELVSKVARETLREALRRKTQKDIYPSMDLDILTKTEITVAPGLNQGILELSHLLNIVDVIQEEKNIISADILGYTGINYFTSDLIPVTLLVYATLAAKIIGKDTKELEKLHDYFKKRRGDKNFESLTEFKRVTKQLRI